VTQQIMKNGEWIDDPNVDWITKAYQEILRLQMFNPYISPDQFRKIMQKHSPSDEPPTITDAR